MFFTIGGQSFINNSFWVPRRKDFSAWGIIGWRKSLYIYNVSSFPLSFVFCLVSVFTPLKYDHHHHNHWLQHRNTQETLAVLDRLDLDTEKPSDDEIARKFGFEDAYNKGDVSWWQGMKPQIWSLFDEPYSSNAAKVITTTSHYCVYIMSYFFSTINVITMIKHLYFLFPFFFLSSFLFWCAFGLRGNHR